MKTRDITDEQVVAACAEAHETFLFDSLTVLMARTDAPIKVAIGAMRRADQRGLIDYGVTLCTAWATDKGRQLLEES